MQHKRIAVVGNSGSGKSYFAKRLAKISGLPLVYLDAAYWRPGWQKPLKKIGLHGRKSWLPGRNAL